MRAVGADVSYFLQPLTQIHLHSHLRHELRGNGDITYVYIFSVVAISILLMACINFINLATARSAHRAKEIGIRKMLGSARRQLVFQFYGESLLFSLFSLMIALIVVHLTLPVFSTLAERNLAGYLAENSWLYGTFFGLALFVGLAAGSYPALRLSGNNPLRTLKAKSGVSSAGGRFRQVLVTTQFAISIALILGTLIIVNQLDFMKNKDLGFDQEQVMFVRITDRALVKSLEAVKTEFLRCSGVLRVAAGSPGNGKYQPDD